MPPRPTDQEQQRDDHELLIRLDERVQQMHIKLDRFIEDSAKETVTRNEFIPVQRAVYAAIGFIATGVIGGLVTLLIKGAMR